MTFKYKVNKINVYIKSGKSWKIRFSKKLFKYILFVKKRTNIKAQTSFH